MNLRVRMVTALSAMFFFLCVACKNEKRDEKMRAKIKRQELIFLAIVFICISDELTCSVSSAKGLTDG